MGLRWLWFLPESVGLGLQTPNCVTYNIWSKHTWSCHIETVFERTYKLAGKYHKNGIKKSNLSNFWLTVSTVVLRDEERSKRDYLGLKLSLNQ